VTCIKTGAHLYIRPYGSTVPADIFEIAGARVARVPLAALEDHTPSDETPTWILDSPPGGANEFWRPDLGVFVVPADLLFEIPF